ncbi:MAG TPA: hypothetical protein VI893_07590 [Thermoplasmata archaeon]|nr:hypothetical protein [Thermoplasmata archaeon]
MRIVVEEKNGIREFEMTSGSSVSDLARKIGVPVESAIFLLGDRPLPTDELLTDGWRVRVVSAVSGG